MASRRITYKNVHYVYIHVDPNTNQIVYVGKGSSDRAWHLTERSEPHIRWVNGLRNNGLSPIVKIVHKFKDSLSAYEREKLLIEYLSNTGQLRFNRAKGGSGKPDKLIPWNKGKKTNHIPWNKGKKTGPNPSLSEPTRLRMMGNTIRKNVPLKAETKIKISKSLMGNSFRSVPIFCFNNKKTYKSVKDAWVELKLDERSVFRVLKGQWVHTKGYRFSYV